MVDALAGIKDYLCIPYRELEELNMDMKRDREQGKSPEHFRDKVFDYLKREKRIKAVTVCFSDIEGKFLRLDYDKHFLLESYDSLTFDGSSIKGFTAQCESDLRLKIDWSSFRWLPADIFGSGKVMVFANVCDKDGSPFRGDFRGYLQILAGEMKRNDDMVAHVAPEIEGILLSGVDAEQEFDERVGFGLVTRGGYFNSLPQDELRVFIDRVAEAKRAMAFENEKDHPEVAPSQFELNYKYTDILQAADEIQIYKLTCRQVAKSMGLTASFLAKPAMNINGNGMHTNMSIVQGGRNIFYGGGPDHQLSEFAHNFLTSILYHAKDMCLILNASVNDYRRLDPLYEAPNEIKVSPSDRGSMVRIPLANENSSRIEVRSVAPDANPYLLLFTLLKIGLKGVNATPEEKEEFATILSRREKLPSNIYDALRYFKRSDAMMDLLGKENHVVYSDLKEQVANRAPKELGTRIKAEEILYHHEITNQSLWSKF